MRALEARENNRNENISIPIKDKINLTIKEAVKYSNIGEKTIRTLLKKKGCPFLLKVGNKQLIKRREFEKYLQTSHYL
ncbi:MAG: helix-turn-helix domain-containing protein [Lachnospiraceae bacterium]|jgi:excisionase family DNA binding protein|nr:helix-turn-helix domain-containing protein [Lachnospiraceae bacterium]